MRPAERDAEKNRQRARRFITATLREDFLRRAHAKTSLPD